jgi:hypothetical protein
LISRKWLSPRALGLAKSRLAAGSLESKILASERLRQFP